MEIIKKDFKCDSCGRIIEGKDFENHGIVVYENGYKHQHHFCNNTCLGNWAKAWANK